MKLEFKMQNEKFKVAIQNSKLYKWSLRPKSAFLNFDLQFCILLF